MIRVKKLKAYGKHPDVGWWFAFTILPSLVVARTRDFLGNRAVYNIAIAWLFWSIEINNNKNY